MSMTPTLLNQELIDYLSKISVKETPVQTALRIETQKLAQGQMQVPPYQAQFMQWLIRLIHAKKVLEIGVFTGYCTLAMALALPLEGKIFACDINAQSAEIAQKYWRMAGVENKIQLYLQAALVTLDTLHTQAENNFDFIFIDADKANYLHYFEKTLPLLKVGGLILLDNVFLAGRVTHANVNSAAITSMRELNQLLLNDKRVDITVLPIADGLTLVRKL